MMKKNTIYFLLFFLSSFILKPSNCFVAKKPRCPQKRTTLKAPDEYYYKKNPYTSIENIKFGNKLYSKTAKPIPCKICHGDKGQANGIDIPYHVTNFTCKTRMEGVTQGQMFYIIKFGNEGKDGKGKMMPFEKFLTDKQIWQVVSYIESEFVER